MNALAGANGKGEALFVSPHPDDEILGPGRTGLRLAALGHHVTNIAVTLGISHQRQRRFGETTEACERAGYELLVPSDWPELPSEEDLETPQYQAHFVSFLADLIRERRPKIVVSPGVHDNHPHHEIVANMVKQAIPKSGQPTAWWMYAVWGDLPWPTITGEFAKDELSAEYSYVLDAHGGELARNTYERFAYVNKANVAKAPEKILEFGADNPSTADYADLFTEVFYEDGRWLEGEDSTPLDFDHPFTEGRSGVDLTDWLHSPSPRQIIKAANLHLRGRNV